MPSLLQKRSPSSQSPISHSLVNSFLQSLVLVQVFETHFPSTTTHFSPSIISHWLALQPSHPPIVAGSQTTCSQMPSLLQKRSPSTQSLQPHSTVSSFLQSLLLVQLFETHFCSPDFASTTTHSASSSIILHWLILQPSQPPIVAGSQTTCSHVEFLLQNRSSSSQSSKEHSA